MTSRRGRGPGGATEKVARQQTLRAHNIALVLRAILESPEPLTRATIAGELGLTRATVSGLVDQLIEAGFAQDLPPTAPRGAGRPGIPVAPSAGKVLSLGVAVQVDHLTVGLADVSGTVVLGGRTEDDYRESDPAQVVEQVARLAAPLLDHASAIDATVLGVGFSIPGLLRRGGEVLFAPNLRWEQVDLRAIAGAHPTLRGRQLAFSNDADAAALAESWAKARADRTSTRSQNFLHIAGEVGLGGAVIVGGDLLHGQHGWSGEIGHMCVDPRGPECSCGAHGCLEAFAGRDAIFRAAGLHPAQPTRDLVAAVEARHPAAVQAVETAGDMLGIGIANALNLVDVDRVVLGGFLRELHPLLSRAVSERVGRHLLIAPWIDPVIHASCLDQPAAVIGAARLALERAIANPSPWLGDGGADDETLLSPATRGA